ncbi:MAG: NAD-dependent epimerase/dehydratase family protein, partial [Tannerella sp.]|nr:NAD-dependent epimerase/dehydratase family protein [Tannerella sp.]
MKQTCLINTEEHVPPPSPCGEGSGERSKILITGASGFIGSFLVEEALNKSYQVWAGIRSTSNRQYLRDERIAFINLN